MRSLQLQPLPTLFDRDTQTENPLRKVSATQTERPLSADPNAQGLSLRLPARPAKMQYRAPEWSSLTLADLMTVTISILVANSNRMTLSSFLRFFRESEGSKISYKAYGFQSLIELFSSPSFADEIRVHTNTLDPTLALINNEATQHIQVLVSHQKKGDGTGM